MTIEELDAKMSAEFAAVRAHVEATIKAEGDSIRAQVDARITAEGETTRRHFDIVAEQFKERTKVLADGIGRNTERLDDHEKRISTIESRRS
jgi:BMFP domain-containing protein YqiC